MLARFDEAIAAHRVPRAMAAAGLGQLTAAAATRLSREGAGGAPNVPHPDALAGQNMA